MRKIFIFLIFTILFFAGYDRAFALTYIENDITEDTTWTKENSPYVLYSPIVYPGVTLTIEPGVVVKVLTNSNLYIEGTLIANGTPEEEIYFTSTRDDSVGGDVIDDCGTVLILPILCAEETET